MNEKGGHLQRLTREQTSPYKAMKVNLYKNIKVIGRRSVHAEKKQLMLWGLCAKPAHFLSYY